MESGNQFYKLGAGSFGVIYHQPGTTDVLKLPKDHSSDFTIV